MKGVESRSWKVCGGPGDGFFLKMKSPGFPFGLGVPPLFHDLGLAHLVILLATVLTQTSSLLGFNLSGLDKRYHHSWEVTDPNPFQDPVGLNLVGLSTLVVVLHSRCDM